MAIQPLSKYIRETRNGLSSLELMRRAYAYTNLFSDERRLLYETLNSFVGKHLVPHTVALHTGKMNPNEAVSKFSEYFGIGIPEKYGGIDANDSHSIVESVIFHDCVGYGSTAVTSFFDGNTLFSGVLVLAGSEEQKQKYLPLVANGKLTGCYALTDIECGSDVRNMSSMTYTYDEASGIYTLNGSKNFVTNAPFADAAIVFAVDKGKPGEITAFIVPAAGKNAGNGFISEKRMEKVCWASSDTAIIHADNVTVRQDAVVGNVGDGSKIVATILGFGRLKVAGEAFGMTRGVLDAVRLFSAGRRGIGKIPLQQSQLYTARFADEVVIPLIATRDVLYNTALRAEKLTPDADVFSFAIEAAIVKNLAGANFAKAVFRGVKALGGAGVVYEGPMAVYYSEVPLYWTGEGAEDALNMFIGQTVFGMPEKREKIPQKQ